MTAERELIYRIKFVEDEGSRETLQRIKREGIAVQQEVDRITSRRKSAADVEAREAKRSADQRIREEQRVAREAERTAQRTAREQAKAAREAARAQSLAAREQAQEAKKTEREQLRIARDQERAAKESARAQEREAKQLAAAKIREEKAATRAIAAEQKQQEREAARATAQAERDAQRATRTREAEAKKAAAAATREAKRAADAEVRERERVAAAWKATQQGLANRAESQGATAEGARSRFRNTALEGTESLLRVSRGFVASGLVGEKDLEVLARSLVKLQAGIDIIAGGAKLWIKSAEAVKAYRQAVEAAGFAEAALVAMRARSAAAETAGAAGGGLRAAAARSGSGAIGSAATGAAGSAIAGRLIGGGGAAAVAGGGGAAAAGGGALGAAGPIGAFVAAVLAAGAALKVIWEIVTGAADDLNSWTNTIASAEVKVAEFARIVELGGKAVETAEKSREKLLEGLARREALIEAGAPLAGRGLSKEQAIADSRLKFYSGPEQYRPIAFAEEEQRTRFEQIRTGMKFAASESPTERSQLFERQAELATRLVSLAEQRFQIERDLAEKTKQKAEETLKLRQEELQTIRDQLKERSERLVGAAERFGQLSPAEQARAIEAKQKADRLGPQALSKEERATLRGIGLDATERAARQGDVLDAERAGFSRFFGAEERRDIAALQGQERKTTLEIKGQRELLIRLEKQEEAEVSRAAKEIAKLVAEREDAITAKIRDEVAKQIAGVNRQTNAQARQRAAAAG